MELFGLIIFSSLFILSGYNHLRNHAAMVGYTTSSLGNCPVAKPLGYVGGWPTGLFLIVAGVAAAFSQVWALYSLAAFLAVTATVFHRNLKDPANMKQLALIGSTLALAALV